MTPKTKSDSDRPISPVVDIRNIKPAPREAATPDVIVVFELDSRQFASARAHFDHLIDNHGLSACVHFEEQI